MNTKRLEYTLDALDKAVHLLDETTGNCSIITFIGSLGAGKTTLIGSFLKSRGVKDVVTSPTFAYMNIYTATDGHIYIHFDLYRLDTVNQFIEAGFDEYLCYPGATVLIEWPEVIASLLEKMSHCTVNIEYADTKRILTVTTHV